MKLRKKIVVICVLGLLILFVKWFECEIEYNTKYYYSKLSQRNIKLPNIKYVLLWSRPTRAPLNSIPQDREMFIRKKCLVKNCYITSNMNYFDDVTSYDAILFHGSEVRWKRPGVFLPNKRSPSQSYIFVSTESADYYFVPDKRYNQVFNFTWTYKLDSDVYFGYIIIRNQTGNVIGPSINMSWISVDEMLPINETVKEKLKDKKIAAAWFVSNCVSLSKRQKLAFKIMEELDKYNMTVDIFGQCWSQQCPRDSDRCLKMLQRDYYFYFAFENSSSDDYVTEKLLTALQNYAVPVVFGGAHYTRFMPNGIYLDARNMSVTELVNQMVGIINDKHRYYNFFKWRNHYSYHSPEDSSETDSYCEFCNFINQIKFGGKAIDDFFQWWNPHPVGPPKMFR